MLQFLIPLATAFGAIGGTAGLVAIVRVFAVDRKVVKRDDLAAERAFSERLRLDLDAEILGRRRDRQQSDEEIMRLREEIGTLRNNWDACRAECQRLRLLVQGGDA